jgi:hypothetical protein
VLLHNDALDNAQHGVAASKANRAHLGKDPVEFEKTQVDCSFPVIFKCLLHFPRGYDTINKNMFDIEPVRCYYMANRGNCL